MAKKKGHGEAHQNHERWLLTYADMMNNLLILFMMLYAISSLDLQKYKQISQGLSDAFKTETTQTSSAATKAPAPDIAMAKEDTTPDNFDQLYETLKEKVKQNGYQDMVTVEKGSDFIRLQFKDNVLFYPDSPQMRDASSTQVLKSIGDILKNIDNMIQSVEIGGHTASTGGYTDSFFSWELSSERALAVLKFMVKTCGLPESKMSITGYSKYHPISSNDTEESRSANRRVEIKITRVGTNTSTTMNSSSSTTSTSGGSTSSSH